MLKIRIGNCLCLYGKYVRSCASQRFPMGAAMAEESVFLWVWAPILVTAVGVVFTADKSIRGRREGVLERLRTDEKYRGSELQQLEKIAGWVERGVDNYVRFLGSALRFCFRWWGRIGSPRSLGVSLILALFYSLIIFILCWAFMGPGSIGNTTLLDSSWTQSQRFQFVSVVGIVYCIVFIFIVYSTEIHKFSVPLLEEVFSRAITKFRAPIETVISRFDSAFFSESAPTKNMDARKNAEQRGNESVDRSQDENPTNPEDHQALGRAMFAAAGCTLVFLVFLVPPFAYIDNLQGFEIFLVVALSLPFVATILAATMLDGSVPILVGISAFAGLIAYAGLFFGESVPLVVSICTLMGFSSAFWLGIGRRNPKRRNPKAAAGITGSIGGFFVGYLASSSGDFTRAFSNPEIVGVLLFLVFLPLVNGVFDWVSLSVTRILGHLLHRVLTGETPNQMNITLKVSIILGCTIIDIVLGFLLLIAIVASATYLIQTYNISADKAGLDPPLEIGDFIRNVKQDPIGANGAWVSFMIFSTLIPTAAHLVAVLFASCIALRPRKSLARRILEDINSDSHMDEGYRKLSSWIMWRNGLRTCIGLSLVVVLSIAIFQMFYHLSDFSLSDRMHSVAQNIIAITDAEAGYRVPREGFD